MANMGLPSFFKVLISDFKSILRIPPLFGKTYVQALPERALLQTKSGETWSVKIEWIDERYCFTNGWPKFANDLELKMGEFLVFWLTLKEKIIFKVAIYGTTGCEKDLKSPSPSHNPGRFEPEMSEELNLETARNQSSELFRFSHGSRRGKSRKVENEKHGRGATISDDSAYGRQYFVRVLKKYHQSRMHIPIRFAKKTGIIHKSEVKLQNLNGGSWCVSLQMYNNSLFYMCKGWPDFRKMNKLTWGSRYAFEFIPETDSIQVQRLKQQRQSTAE